VEDLLGDVLRCGALAGMPGIPMLGHLQRLSDGAQMRRVPRPKISEVRGDIAAAFS